MEALIPDEENNTLLFGLDLISDVWRIDPMEI